MTTALVPFTNEDYAARMRRAVTDAAQADLDGLLIALGPDLVWFTGRLPAHGGHRTPDAAGDHR